MGVQYALNSISFVFNDADENFLMLLYKFTATLTIMIYTSDVNFIFG